jgi:protocatechuate 3,4-dioxygenase beta subunit
MSDDRVKTNRSPGKVRRREALGMLGVAGAAILTRCRSATGPNQEPDCVVTPAQTDGPYFVDERLNRADIRLDPTTQEVKEGVPLRLQIHVSRVDGSACTPVEGAFVDVWQCDAQGVYSDVRDISGLFDTRGQKFLRGYQVTGQNGEAGFVTIYPGWYPGRTVHIHFKVRLFTGAQQSYEFASQLYFDDAITDQVLAQPPYSAKGARSTRNDSDGIYRNRDSGSQLLLRLDQDEQGYVGTIAVGLRMS